MKLFMRPLMKPLVAVAALSGALFAFSPADAQVSTQNPNLRPTYICKAKASRKPTLYTATSKKNVSFAKNAALSKCRKGKGNKGCKIDSCVG